MGVTRIEDGVLVIRSDADDAAVYGAPKPPPPPTVTGNQWAFALSDLGLASAWLAALAKSKPSD